MKQYRIRELAEKLDGYMVDVKIDPNQLNPTELAALYVLLNRVSHYSASDRVMSAGVANCGAEDFNAEIKRVREVMF